MHSQRAMLIQEVGSSAHASPEGQEGDERMKKTTIAAMRPAGHATIAINIRRALPVMNGRRLGELLGRNHATLDARLTEIGRTHSQSAAK